MYILYILDILIKFYIYVNNIVISFIFLSLWVVKFDSHLENSGSKQ